MFGIKSIFSETDEEAEVNAISEAQADIELGQFVSHEKVVKWLRSWDTPDELPAIFPNNLPYNVDNAKRSSPGKTVVWTLSSIKDVEVIRRYIKNFNPFAARAMAIQIIEVASNLTISPYRGRLVRGPQLRAVPLARPYIIKYRIIRTGSLIMRVRHSARRLP
jgi:plasmid stabilization system protein ParE